MDELSLRKKLNIIRLYFSGLSYREIAAKAGVSVGAISNVIADMKAGNYPEVSDVSEQVDALRELGAEVRKSRLTVGQAVTGITIVNSVKELGLEPGDIPQYVSLCKSLTPGGIETQSFVKAALEYREVLGRTGLGVEELDKKVKALEEAAGQLEPLAKKTVDLKGELKNLEAKKGVLTGEVAGLEKRQQRLTEIVKEREQREGELSARIAPAEASLQSDEERLALARKDLKKLSSIGMSFDELSGFTERLAGVAHRHGLTSKALCDRLLTELEQLDKGLGLKTFVQTRQLELNKLEEAITKAQEKSAALNSQNRQLEQELASIKAQIANERDSVVKEMRIVNAAARDTVTQLKQDLSKGIRESLDEVSSLRKETFETGKELGVLEAMIESHALFKDILSLIKGEDKITASQVRVVALILLKSMVAWLERNHAGDTSLRLLRTTTTNIVSELERWIPPVNSAEGSKSLTAN